MFESIDYFDDRYWELARELNLADVEAALIAEGWGKQELDERVAFRRTKGGVQHGIDLPRKDDPYYISATLHAASDYAVYWDIPTKDALERWRMLRFDQARFRIVTEEAEGGALPLENVVELAQGVVSALSSATKDVESPSNAHKRVSSSAINELAKRARFGLTEKGSYVVNVYVPTEETKDGGVFRETSGRLFRRGLEHLAATYELAGKIGDESVHAFLVANEEERASANLLEAIAKTTFDGKADVEFSVKWSPLVKPTRAVPSRVYLKKERAEKLRERANTLRLPPIIKKGTFCATILALEELGRGVVDGRPFGKAAFIVEDDEEDYRAEALLDADDFQKAYEAFYPKISVAFEAFALRNGWKADIKEVRNLRQIK